ncbi:MAG: Holliday junction branch migration protein RuvA [Clostridia bacterium]|nr:Holliday junction branch migration protein RuvA [Clostridia bacterium]
MFYSITGNLVTTELNAAVVDNNGIAFYLNISAKTHEKLSPKLGEKVTLYTYLNVKEDGLDLFGFFSREELMAFRLLITISGVGPKAAMSILSQLTPEQFACAVGMGDTKAISKAPGVGPKTAARIVLELKDKVAKQLSVDTETDMAGRQELMSGKDVLSEAMNALLVLGYTRGEAANVLKTVDPALSLEDTITAALKKLMK